VRRCEDRRLRESLSRVRVRCSLRGYAISGVGCQGSSFLLGIPGLRFKPSRVRPPAASGGGPRGGIAMVPCRRRWGCGGTKDHRCDEIPSQMTATCCLTGGPRLLWPGEWPGQPKLGAGQPASASCRSRLCWLHRLEYGGASVRAYGSTTAKGGSTAPGSHAVPGSETGKPPGACCVLSVGQPRGPIFRGTTTRSCRVIATGQTCGSGAWYKALQY
jgi:hypothetical protein